MSEASETAAELVRIGFDWRSESGEFMARELLTKLAAEVTRLESERAELRAALEAIADTTGEAHIHRCARDALRETPDCLRSLSPDELERVRAELPEDFAERTLREAAEAKARALREK